MAKALNVSLSVTADTTQAKAALQQLQQTLNALSTNTNLNFGGNGSQLTMMTQEIMKAQQAAGQLKQQLAEATNVNTGKLDLVKFNQSLQNSGMSIAKYRDQLLTLGVSGEKAFTQLAQSILKADVPLRKTSSLFSEFRTTLSNTIRWQFSSSFLHGMMGTIQGAYKYAQDLNKSLTDIQIVTQASDEHMARFAEQANKSAKALSTTTTAYTKASLIYYQQGLNDQQVKERTDVTVKMANITGQSAQQVSDQMTAIWNNFAKGGQNLEYYADVITALGAATASSSEEISRGLEKFAAIADTVGLSYENATAALATITATTRQSADTVGTGLRTLFSRLQSLSLGETLEDGVNLTKYSKALKTIGVDVLDTSGNLREMDDILEDMGERWDKLTDAQKTAVAQTVGGVRQYTTLMALMENFDFYKQNQQVAAESEGTVQKQQEIYEKSWQASAKRVRASAESIYGALLDDKFFIGLTDLFAKVLDGVNLFIKGLGGVRGALLTVFAIATSRQGNAFAQFIDRMKYNIEGKRGDHTKAAMNVQQQTAIALKGMAGYGPGSGSATATILGEQGSLYEHLVQVSQNLNAEDQKRAAALYDIAAAMNEGAINASRQAEAAEKELAARAQIAALSKLNKGSTESDLLRFQEQVKAAGHINYTSGGIIQGLSTAKINAGSNQTPNILPASIMNAQLNRIFNQAQLMGGSSGNEISQKVAELQKRIQDLGTTDTGMIKFSGDLKEAQTQAQGLIDLLQEIQRLSKETFNTQGKNRTPDGKKGIFKKDTDAATEANQAFETGKKQAEAENQKDNAVYTMRQTKKGIDDINNTPLTLGQKVSNAASAVMSLGMAISTVKGLIDTWNSTDLTIGDKLTATFTSVAMALGMMINAYTMLNTLTSVNNALTTVGSVVHAGLTAVEAAEIPVVSALAAAMGKLNASALAFIALLAIIAVAIFAITKVGTAIANAIVTPKEHLENLAAQTEQAKTAAEEAKTAYDNLLSGINTHNQLLEELDKLTVGTLEFQEALLAANTAASELISNYNLSPDDYTIDQNGAIRISDEALQRVRGEKLRESQQRQEEYLTAQAVEATAKSGFFGDMGAQNYIRYIKEHDEVISWQYKNTRNGIVDIDATYQENKNRYDALAAEYGYSNGLEYLNARQNNPSDYKARAQKRAMIESGAASKNQNAIQNKLLSAKGGQPLDDFDTLLASSMALDPEIWNRIDEDATKYNRRTESGDKNGKWINLDNTNTTKGSLETEYKRIFGEQALLDLQASNTWGNLGDEDARRRYLANAIKEFNSNQLLEEELNEKKELANREEIKQYKKASKLTGQEIIELRLASLENRKKADTLEGTDKDAAELEAKLNDALWERYQTTSKAFISAGMQAFGYGTDSGKQFSELAKTLRQDQMEEFNGLYGQAVKSFGENTGKFIAENYFKDDQINRSFQTALRGFDMSQGSISALADLRSGKSSFGAWDENAEDFTKSDIYNFADSIYKNVGEKGLFEELYQSEDFADSLSSLQKEFKKTGKISATSIMEAAESSETLSDWLEVSGVGAQGLADALSALESGNIDTISEALLRAFGAAGQLESSLAKTYDYIDNFEAERSIGDIGKFYSDLADSVQQGFESGFLLDKPVLQALEETFGVELRNQYMKDIYDFAGNQQISDIINNKYADQIQALQSIQKRGDLSGMFEYVIKRASEDSDIANILSYNQKTGSITSKKWDEMSADQQDIVGDQEAFINMLQKAGGISEELARAMANEYGMANGDIYKKWRETAALKGLGEFGAEDISSINAADLRAFYDSYGDVLQGLSREQLQSIFPKLDLSNFDGELSDANELVSLFKQNTQNLGKTIVDLGEDFNFASDDLGTLKDAFKENSENSQEFIDYFNEGLDKTPVAQTEWDEEKGIFAETGEQTIGVDFDNATEKLTDLGASADQAYAKLDEMRDAGDISAFTRSVFDAENGTRELNSEMSEFKQYCQDMGLEENAAAFDQWTQSINNSEEAIAETQQQAKIFAEALVQALGGDSNNINLTFNDDGTLATLKTTINDFGNDPVTIKFATPDTTPISDAIKTIEDTSINVKINATPASITINAVPSASGYNNAKGFSGGKHSNGQYEGLAEVGELGPELFIHDGQPYLAGINGRTKAYVHKDDSIYTAAETRQILEENPSLQDIPGFYGGYNKVAWGKSGASASNAKTSKYDPERYHLITRQLKDLQREYDRLDKIKENCYGTNKFEAIQREIDATNELIKGQKELVKETEDYLKIDTDRLKNLLGAGEFQVDEKGNLLNFEELQEKYRRKAEEDKDEQAQNIWKALQQYEETLDKFQEANVEMRDLLYQEMELRLEKITTKVDMRIDFDDREIKLLDHYIERIDDNIYHTAKVLSLTEEKFGRINQKIKVTTEGIYELFNKMSDSEGKLITKSDGTAYTLNEWLALTDGERDLLDINGQFGKQLEEYMDNLLDYIEELEEFKTKGVEEFGEAFDELNDNVRSSIDLFDHYNQLLSSLKNITDLQGVKLSTEMRAARKEIDQIMFKNTQNNIQAENENYKRLVSEVEDLRMKIADTQDETLKKAWEEQLKTAEEQLRTSEQNMLSLWETGLDQAKNMFEQALQDAVDVYESAIAGMYGTVDELEKAWDQQKKNNDFYVKDFEKYYQIQKLQRSITKDLDAATRAGNKQNQGLKKLYEDLNAAREDGVELSSYDLDIYAKRYEYEKALIELEDARNNKNEVRLQRDANGNWGYVYTSSADEDDLIAKQQAVDDKFYELQKATQERVASLSDDLMSEITSVGQRLQELRSSGASQDTIDKYLGQEKLYLENYEKGLAKALEDAGMTEEEARSRYGDAGFDILNDFQETLFSAITGGDEGLNEFFNRVSEAIKNTDSEMAQAGSEYQKQVSTIDKWFNESGEDLAKVLQGFAALVGEESSGTLLDSKEQIDNAKQTFTDILQVARDFEQEFMTIYQPIIDANEQLVADLLKALHALNREEYEGPEHNKSTIADIQSNNTMTRMATGGYTGSWGPEGRMAILDEKELVLNKDDTKNFLNATAILRTIDLQTGLFSKGLGNIITPFIADMQQGVLDQNVHIDATFPNVTDHNEIEAAFDNLINKASQYANRKNMSSMTFNDMYISRF